MGTVRIQRSLAGFSVDGGELLPLGTAQRRAIDLAVAMGGLVTITMQDADPNTYQFSRGVVFEWMTLRRKGRRGG